MAHPVIASGRDVAGKLTMFGVPAPGVPGLRESFIHIHVERLQDDNQRNEIIAGLASVLADVRRVVEDWKPMLGARSRRDRRSEGQSAADTGR